jgi:DNA-binding NarL/FixJ family response regulator
MPTVFIVDDHALFRASVKALLTADGYDVVGEAGDGEVAIGEIERLRPDVVLLDIQLPGIDGFEVADRVATGDRAPEIVLTSSREPGDFGGLVAGSAARGFVPKAELSGAALQALLGE